MLKSINVKQRGDFLIESMIGVLLMGIVGAGITFVTSRVSVSQQQMAMQEIAVSKLRGMLLANGSTISLCEDPVATPYVYLPNGDAQRVTVNCTSNATATIAGVDLTDVKTPVVLTVHLTGIGEVRVGGQL